jgi:hypothetical protein
MKRDGEDLSSLDPNSGKRQDVSSIGRPPSPDPSLLSGANGAGQWEQHVSAKTGKPYWFNPATGQTQWTMPSSFFPTSPPPESAATEGHTIIGPGEGPRPQEHVGQPASSSGIKISMDSSSAINYPKRPGQQRCTYYLTHGTCKFGESCKYDHPADR